MIASQPGMRRRQEVRHGSSAARLECWAEVYGALVTPSSGATVAIYRPGQSAPETTAACTVSSTYLLSCALDASDTAKWALGTDYVAEFAFTADGVTHVLRRSFDVVRVPLREYPPCRVDDLKNAHKSVDAALAQLSISDAHSRFILPAWEDVILYVEGKGYRPALVTDPEALAPMLRARALLKLARAMRSTASDVWSKLAEEFAADYDEAQTNTVLRWSPADQHASVQADRSWQQPGLTIGPDPGVLSTSSTAGLLAYHPVGADGRGGGVA